MAIHDVEVEPLGARSIDPADFLFDPGKVRGEQRWRDDFPRWTGGGSSRGFFPPLPCPGSQAVAGAGVPSPGWSLGGAGLGTSGNGVAAMAPVGGSVFGIGGGGVNFPVRTISST